MKNSMRILLVAFSLVVVGCGSKKSESPQGLLPPGLSGFDTPIPAAPGQSGDEEEFSTGSTVELKIESAALLSQFVLRSLNDPQNVKINVTLDDFGEGAFGGFVKIAYDDGQHHVVDEFSAGQNASDARYNVWFTSNGQEVWHGFFEDEYGGLIVVIDEVTDLGDGLSTGQVGGSVWFKNFQSTSAPNPSNGCLPGFGCPSTRCWFVEIGPYECRSFLVDGVINTTALVEPNNGYTKLGEFSGLDRARAFNQ